MMVEVLGYLASIFIGMSLLMTNVHRLRYINALGCSMFVIYGSFIGALPVVFMNGLCVLINIYHVIKLNKEGNKEINQT